jgi:hypothetical protein
VADTRTVSGTILHPVSGDPWASGSVIFTLRQLFVASDATHPPEEVSVTADVNGDFSVTLAVPDSGVAAYQVQLPDGAKHYFYLEAGTPVTLETLLAASISTGDPDDLQLIVDTHAADAGDPHPGYVLESSLATKGDLLAGGATGAAILPIGANYRILVADAAEDKGMRWSVAPDSAALVGAAMESLLKGTLLTKKANQTVTTGGPHFDATVASVGKTLVIPPGEGTFTTGGAYVTDLGWFKTVSAVYNLTDDAARTTNLYSSFAVGTQTVTLTTGTDSSKEYEVQGIYQPYQGILDGTESLEIAYVSPSIIVTSSGTGTPGAGTVATVYIPISPKFPMGAGYADVSLLQGDVGFAGIGNYSASSALRQSPVMSFQETLIRPYEGAVVVVSSAAVRGFVRADVGGVRMLAAGMNLNGSVPHAAYLPMVVRVIDPGSNALLTTRELLLFILGQTITNNSCVAYNANDAYKFTADGLVN